MKTHFLAFVTVAGGAAATLLGGWDAVMRALVALVLLDYITGVMCAIRHKRLSSSAGYKGLFKKASIFVVIILAAQVDMLAPQAGKLFRTAACMFYIANEGISILENVCELGLPIPQKLKDILVQLAEKDKKQD